MKSILLCLLLALSASSLLAQLQPLSVPNPGDNKRATISEHIGFCEVQVRYNRTGVKGREGKIWGTNIAHYGLKDLQFGTSRAAPWRVGANECTVITFSTDVKVGGKPLAAGSYGLLMNLGEAETTVIFNKNTSAWGSFSYNPNDDVLQVTVKNESLENSQEWLKFDFLNQTTGSATLALSWEKRRIPFVIEVDLLKTQFESFKKELETPKGFTAAAFVQAATFCLQNNYEMEQGLTWAQRAIAPVFPGERNFQSLSTYASFLNKQNRAKEADDTMKEAIPLGTAQQVSTYARSLLTQKRTQEAVDIYKANYSKFPNVFATNFGMIRAHSALGDQKKALEFAKLALPQAPNPQQKGIVEKMIKDLEEGKEIN
jgi:tetratricopeptide (TPR) repeat protein